MRPLSTLKALLPAPALGALRALRRRRSRRRMALGYYRPQLRLIRRWLRDSREVANFTYDLTDANKGYLASTVSAVTGVPLVTIQGYLQELERDERLRAHIARATPSGPYADVSDAVQHYGRRLGWYAFVRATKPRVVVETGVEKGLGACVLASALMRNAAEGRPGRYFGTDIDPGAGYLFTPPYSGAGEILFGDSILSLVCLGLPIDLFINDSDHSADYEAREYETVSTRLAVGAIVLADNAHATDALWRFAERTGRRFLFFREEPKDHWYPGAGIGIAFPAPESPTA